MTGPRFQRGLYQTRPTFEIKGLRVLEGAGLDNALAALAGNGSVVVDGFQGVNWSEVRQRVQNVPALARMEIADTREAWLSPDQIKSTISPYLGDPDPVFGKLYEGNLEMFFQAQRLRSLRERASRGNLILIGPGAALAHDSLPLIYVDLSKESLQRRPESQINLGEREAKPVEFYKRAYFIDWPVLERHRNSIRSRIAIWIDTNQSSRWLGLNGVDLRMAIAEAARRPFRVKPWFLPGPWGGQFMKGHMGLDPSQPNYAWSYELIAPENGVLVGPDTAAVQIPFPFMVAQDPEAYIGPGIASRFGNQFPIRFDYLDTIGGGNLSCQCHPSLEYIRSQFGELFTQDESYYLVECTEGSTVFLGFNEGIDAADFWRAARQAQTEGKPFKIADYIHQWPARKHDIFLIPNGTVHCSGSGNLVLEISATPYIFTFKIYDYLRCSLNGGLRPVHIEHAERNARPERTATWVQTNLIPLARLLNRGVDWEEYVVADSPLLFYAVHRLDFFSRAWQETGGSVQVVNLVEGEQADILSDRGSLRIHYAETAVIPAAVGHFELVNQGQTKSKLVRAFVKQRL